MNSAEFERLVAMYVRKIQRGEAVTLPIAVKNPGGSVTPLDDDSRAKVEAAKRCGEEVVDLYMIAADTDPALLEKLRRERD